MFKDRTILLVDDDERNIFAINAVLKSFGLNLLVAYDGKQCLHALNENPDIDLVLLDMMMPIMDGYQTLKEIRSNEKTKELSVIALTAQAMAGDKERCIEAGANEYCSKPIDVDLMVSQIKKLLLL